MKIIGTVKPPIPVGYIPGYRAIERQVGECANCKRRVILWAHTNQCECGQRYNLFGQAVNESELG